MKKLLKLLFITTLCLSLSACGKKEEPTPQTDSEPIEEETVNFEDIVPQIGKFNETTQPGDDAVSVQIEWEAIDGAEGYEVEYGYFGDDTYTNLSEKNSYTLSFQDMQTLHLKVRAFKTENNEKIYTQWSEKSTTTFEELDNQKS